MGVFMFKVKHWKLPADFHYITKTLDSLYVLVILKVLFLEISTKKHAFMPRTTVADWF